jgi:hypothetical protein
VKCCPIVVAFWYEMVVWGQSILGNFVSLAYAAPSHRCRYREKENDRKKKEDAAIRSGYMIYIQ